MSRTILNMLRWLIVLLAGGAVAVIALRACTRPPRPLPPVSQVPEPPPAGLGRGVDGAARGRGAAAQANADSLETLPWAPFGRAEVGWATYAPLIGRELGTDCAPGSERFAERLAAWQAQRRLAGDGRMDEATFRFMKQDWVRRRPFVLVRTQGVCPDPPAPSELEGARREEGYAGKAIELRPQALAAYRRMAAAARAEVPAMADGKPWLTIFSGYRSPESDAARCAAEQNCQGIVRAQCSPHRTGLALDVYVGQAPGFGPDSSADPNRLYMSKTPVYRWLVTHADRYGFVNYPFEPWHWEYRGPLAAPASNGSGSSAPPPPATPPA